MAPELVGSILFYAALIGAALYVALSSKFEGPRATTLSLVLAFLGAMPLLFQTWQAMRDRAENADHDAKQEARAGKLEKALEKSQDEMRHLRIAWDRLASTLAERPIKRANVRQALRAYNLAVAQAAGLPPTRARLVELAPQFLSLRAASPAAVPSPVSPRKTRTSGSSSVRVSAAAVSRGAEGAGASPAYLFQCHRRLSSWCRPRRSSRCPFTNLPKEFSNAIFCFLHCCLPLALCVLLRSRVRPRKGGRTASSKARE